MLFKSHTEHLKIGHRVFKTENNKLRIDLNSFFNIILLKNIKKIIFEDRRWRKQWNQNIRLAREKNSFKNIN